VARTNLQLRLMTAAVGLPLIAFVAWIGAWPFAAVLALIALLASAEFVHGWLLPSRPIPEALSLGPTFLIPAITVAGVHADERFLLVSAGFAALFAVLGYTPTNAFGPRKPFRVYCWLTAYLGLLLPTLVLVRDGESGREWFFLGLLATFAVDTGAYAVGRAIGRHRMAPKISPKKTWEGAAGGAVAGAAAVLGLNALFETGVGTGTIWPLAIAVPPVAMIGDLLESWMKRRMGVKDASGLLPGHGGFLDRLDSVLLVFPVLYLFLELRVF